MNEDPIVTEVRRVRDKLASRFNYDIHAIFADLRTREHVPDPAHPLVNSAQDWVQTAEAALALNDKPTRTP